MEIRLRLTLQFTLVVAFLLATVLGINYYLARNFAIDSFLDRLKERALGVASVHLEEDESHQSAFSELNRRNKQVLPGECISIFDKNFALRYTEKSDSFTITPTVVAFFRKKPQGVLYLGDRVVTGLTYEDNEAQYFIIASARDVVGNSKLDYMLRTMFLSFVVFLVFIVLAGQFLAKKALDPIRLVMKQVHQISAANLHERVLHANETDEIAQLAFTFNEMLDRLEDAFISQSAFVRNASHELRNPLAAMIGHAEITLNRNRDTAYYQEVMQVLLTEAQRLKHIVNSLLQLSQASPEAVRSNMTLIRIDELALDVAEQLANAKGYRQIRVQLPETSEVELLVEGNQNLLEVAVSNLLDNACKYSDGKPVTLSFISFEHIIQMVIEDKGIGMSPEDLKYFMQPFYRSASVRNREGFGIGMAIANKILQLHHVLIDVESTLEVGTTIELTFERSASTMES